MAIFNSKLSQSLPEGIWEYLWWIYLKLRQESPGIASWWGTTSCSKWWAQKGSQSIEGACKFALRKSVFFERCFPEINTSQDACHKNFKALGVCQTINNDPKTRCPGTSSPGTSQDILKTSSGAQKTWTLIWQDEKKMVLNRPQPGRGMDSIRSKIPKKSLASRTSHYWYH